MPTNPDEYRVTIRLSPELYAQLQARGSHGQPLAAIVRQALVAYLARQPETPESAVELAVAVAAMAARLDGLQDQVEGLAARLEMLAANWQPEAAKSRQPPAATAARAAPGPRKLTPRQVRALRDKHRRGVPVPALMDGGVRPQSGERVSVSSERQALRRWCTGQ
jgi:hypothetical protein